MRFGLHLLAVAALSAVTLGSSVSAAEPPIAAASATAAARAPVALHTPADWIRWRDSHYTPVADTASRHLHAASLAFDAKDYPQAAAELRAASDALKGQAAALAQQRNAAASAKRLRAAVAAIDHLAADVDTGKLQTRAAFDRAFNAPLLSDLDRRWAETDAATWYPVSEEPQRHFSAAAAAYAKQDHETSATEIRKATGYLRLEAGRADGSARRRLDIAVNELDALADSVAQGTATGTAAMQGTFARANSALAYAHHVQATQAWAAKHYDAAGYELKAAAHGLESAAAWAGDGAKQGAAQAASDTCTVGDKLASGARWTGDEINRGFASFDRGFNALAHKLGAKTSSDAQ